MALGWVVSNSSDQECIRAEMYLMGESTKTEQQDALLTLASPTLSAGEITHKNLVLIDASSFKSETWVIIKLGRTLSSLILPEEVTKDWF